MTKFLPKFNLPAMLIAAQFTLVSSAVFAGGDLDDISIQVIGLDEIPADALERIPLPSPDHGGLTDIREGIILNQPAQARPTPADTTIVAPPGVDADPTPPGDNANPK